MKIYHNETKTSTAENCPALPCEPSREKAADLRELYSSLREKHQFLQTLEKQGVPVADLQTLRARTEHALNELQGIMAELGANV